MSRHIASAVHTAASSIEAPICTNLQKEETITSIDELTSAAIANPCQLPSVKKMLFTNLQSHETCIVINVFHAALRNSQFQNGFTLAFHNCEFDNNLSRIFTGIADGNSPENLCITFTGGANHKIDDSYAQYIRNALNSEKCKTGLSIALKNNHITYSGFDKILEALPNGPENFTLDLSDNNVRSSIPSKACKQKI